MVGCNTLYEIVDGFLGIIFRAYGKFVARHPWWFIICSVVLSVGLGIGIIRLEEESDVETAYTPTDGRAKSDRTFVIDNYADATGTNFQQRTLAGYGLWCDVIFKAKDDSSIISQTSLEEAERVYLDILGVSAGSGSDAVNYTELCAKAGGQCAVDGNYVFSKSFNTSFHSGDVAFPLFNDPTNGVVSLDTWLADVTLEQGNLTGAKYLKLRFNLAESDDVYGKSYAWLESFRAYVENYKSNSLDIRYAHVNSLNEELDRSTKGDIVFISLTFTIMITYASTAVMGTNCLSNRGFLANAGVLAAGMAIFGAIGLMSACGVKFVNIVGVMPFLVLGVGVDDMFILLSSLADVQHLTSTEEKIAEVMRTAGVSITITSITDLLGFCVGSVSVFLSVKNFCLYTGVAIIICYINMVTFFLGCLAINEKRVEAGRHSATCMRMSNRESMEEDGKSKMAIICCGAVKPKSRKDVEGILERWPRVIVSKLLKNIIVRVVILLLFAAYLGVSIYGASNVKQGLELKDTTPDDSYFNAYQLWYAKFPFVHYVSFVFNGEIEYWQLDVRDKIESLLNSAETSNFVQDAMSISWVREFSSLSSFNYTAKSDFVNALTSFLTTRTMYEDDVVIDSQGNIPTSRVYILTKHLGNTDDQGQVMEDMRHTADTSGLSVFAYAFAFIFYEQYTSILSSTFQTVGITVAAVVVATFIFMPQPILMLYTFCSLVMILVGMFGFMYFWGLTLSSITMILLIMSVGFAVDYSVHVSHAYLQADKESRLEKMNVAIDMAASPILNAALSSFFGIFMLLFSQTFIFRAFFKMMFLVILFGFCHSTFFLPSLLSFTGPRGKTRRTIASETNNGFQKDERGKDNGDVFEFPGQSNRSTTRTSVSPSRTSPL